MGRVHLSVHENCVERVLSAVSALDNLLQSMLTELFICFNWESLNYEPGNGEILSDMLNSRN